MRENNTPGAFRKSISSGKEARPSSAYLEAKAAALRSWCVFPVYGIDQRNRCECGNKQCTDAGKHPRITGNLNNATSVLTQIDEWNRKWPRCNWGLATGRSGIVAIDVDPRNGGDETLASLEAAHGRLPVTIRANTGGGGVHILFEHPGPEWAVASKSGALGPGLDVKSDGGYIVLAGSRHWSGNFYEWDKSALPCTTLLAPLPAWLKAAITRKCYRETDETDETEVTSILSVTSPSLSVTSPKPLSVTPTPPDSNLAGSDPRIIQLVEEAIQTTLPKVVGSRNRCIFEFARALMAISEFAEADAVSLKPFVRRWHATALPVIGTKPFDDTWSEFVYGWGRVKFPKGSGALAQALAAADASPDPPEAEQYDAPDTRRLIRLCRELQRHAGNEPFYLSCGSAATLLGTDKMTAWRRLQMLIGDRLITVVILHTNKDATRYRYVGSSSALNEDSNNSPATA